MVVLDQLSTVVRKHTKNKCLITREILGYSVTDINEDAFRKHIIDPKDQQLWKRLLQHFCLLKRFNSIDSSTLSNLFAPSLIAEDGFGREKSIQFLEKVIDSAMANSELNDKSFSENSIVYDHMHTDPKLKESNLYQNFIQQAGGSQKQMKKQFSDDYDEDIDRLVVPKGLGTGTGNSSGLGGTGGTTGSSTSSIRNQSGNKIIPRKSPRANEGEYEFSQSSSDRKDDNQMIIYNPKIQFSRSSSKEKPPGKSN